jgi:hypothetical protein
VIGTGPKPDPAVPPQSPLEHVDAGFYDQEVTVRIPRFRIARLMVFVAIVALNFAAYRACYFDLPTALTANQFEFLTWGALPMVNILAVGIVIGHRRREYRPFLLGFEAFGAAALVLYLAYIAVWLFTDYQWPVRPFVVMVLNPLRKLVGYFESPALNAIFYRSVVAVLMSLPQVAFAVIGGFLSRKCRLILTRRPA